MIPRRLPGTLLPLAIALALGACSSQDEAPGNLSARLQTTLAREIQTNQASVQQLPDGAQVLLRRDLLFRDDRLELGAGGQYTLGSVTQGLLDPRIMEIIIQSDPTYAQSVKEFFERTLKAASPGSLTNAATIVVGERAITATPTADSLILTIRVVRPRQT